VKFLQKLAPSIFPFSKKYQKIWGENSGRQREGVDALFGLVPFCMRAATSHIQTGGYPAFSTRR